MQIKRLRWKSFASNFDKVWKQIHQMRSLRNSRPSASPERVRWRAGL